VATLYANRAAVGLKLLRYEQVIHDSSHALSLVLAKGCSDSGGCKWLAGSSSKGKGKGQGMQGGTSLCGSISLLEWQLEPFPSLCQPALSRASNLSSNCISAEPRMGLEMKGVYGKACMRRGAAWEALGNCMQVRRRCCRLH
jgi:hypothetical protein